MEALEFICELDGAESHVEFAESNFGGVAITCCELGDVGTVAISRADAAQLRDWLNEFLKEGE